MDAFLLPQLSVLPKYHQHLKHAYNDTTAMYSLHIKVSKQQASNFVLTIQALINVLYSLN